MDRKHTTFAAAVPTPSVETRHVCHHVEVAPARLGNKRKSASASASNGRHAPALNCPSRKDAQLVERTALLDFLRPVTTLSGIRGCGCAPRRNRTGEAEVTRLIRTQKPDGTHGMAFSGFQTCGSPWACPQCAAKVREGKARELASLVNAHRAHGGDAVSILLTLVHGKGEALGRVMRRFSQARKRAFSGRPWRRLCEAHGLEGFALALDFTEGVNGWHVHAHGVLVTTSRLNEDSRAALSEAVFVQWREACSAVGAGRPLRRFNRIEEIRSDEAAAAYMTKALREVTRTDTKTTGRSPWALIREYEETREPALLALWREYEQATKGKASVSFSAGALALMRAYGIREAAEQELAEAADEGVVIEELMLSADDVAVMIRVPGRRGIALLRMRDGGSVAVLAALAHWREEDAQRLAGRRDRERRAPTRARLSRGSVASLAGV